MSSVQIDHVILAVNDVATSVDFYAKVLGFKHEGEDGPFSVVRVSEGFTLQLAPWGTKGGEHLAFAMSRAEFELVFARIQAAGLEWGDAFDSVGKQRGPGNEKGARGSGATIYFFDPNKHLLEIRHYEG
jgi:catechol 2,3-dioxygenase-like lactoylglutathione lyase family enzyme